MALQSKLFRGDPALESCLIKDSDHLVPGARGPHVKKVQRALVLLDGALIGGGEVSDEVYGPSTAKAVLAYKTKRKIINPTYQKTADNIVGKMTIAALDKEMAVAEGKPPLQGCFTDLGAGGRVAAAASIRQGLVAGDLRQLEFVPTRLNVSIQEAFLEKETIPGSSIRTVLLVDRAVKLLTPFNLTLVTRFLPSFTYPFDVGERDDVDVRAVRKAAQNASADNATSLRVIFCHLRDTNSTATSQGEITGITGFKNFVLINKDRSHPDNGTLLHEMIHCSDNRFMNDIHDEDKKSIYSRGASRTVLRDEHAISLSKCFFKS